MLYLANYHPLTPTEYLQQLLLVLNFVRYFSYPSSESDCDIYHCLVWYETGSSSSITFETHTVNRDTLFGYKQKNLILLRLV